jgi:hypothetical protein
VDYKPFDVAVDVAKQLLTLATVIVTLTISFWKDIVTPAAVGTTDRIIIGGAWILYLLSILCGIWCLYAINGSVAQPSQPPLAPRSIYDPNIAFPMGGQQITFLLAVIATVVFGIRGL